MEKELHFSMKNDKIIAYLILERNGSMKQTWQLFQDAIKKYSFLLLFAFSLLLMDTSFRAFHQEAGNTFFL